MKIFRILMLSISFLVLSCADDVADTKNTVNEKTAPVLKSPGDDFSMVLSLANADNLAATFVWDYAEYDGAPVAINYSIEFDTAGTSFASPTVIATSIDKFKEFKVSELNQAALDAGFPPFEESSIDIRIKSTLGTAGVVMPQYSNHFTIKLTPYPAWPNWGIIGSATPTAWDSDTNLNYDLSTKIYFITMDLIVGEFKFRLDDGWDTNFGDDGNNLSLDAGGANIPVAVAGTYLIKVNFGTEVSDGIPAKSYTITLQ